MPVNEQRCAVHLFSQPEPAYHQIPVDVPPKILPESGQRLLQGAWQDIPLLRPAVRPVNPTGRALAIRRRLRRLPRPAGGWVHPIRLPAGWARPKAWRPCFGFKQLKFVLLLGKAQFICQTVPYAHGVLASYPFFGSMAPAPISMRAGRPILIQGDIADDPP